MRTVYLPQKYILMTNAYQMAILLQFNDSDSVTLQDLHTATSIPEQMLKNHLSPLVKMKVLLQDGDTYDLNLSTCFGLVFETC
jgi:cullin 1